MPRQRAQRSRSSTLPSPVTTSQYALHFAIFVSILVHGLVLSIRFKLPELDTPFRDRGLEVVLVNARHERPADKPEALAQANLDGGGNTDADVKAASPLPAKKQDVRGDALLQAQRRVQQLEAAQRELLTRAKAETRVVVEQQQQQQPEEARVSGQDLLDSAAAIARLEARVEKRLQEYAKRPRRKFIGARTKEYRFAQYVEDWRQKIERVGTLNYPEAARGKVYGSLLLSVILRADGSVVKIDVIRSSGHDILDGAARRIVELASPFAEFPPAIRRDTDQLEIVRTWNFTNADTLTAQ